MALVISRLQNEGITITVPPSDKETVIRLEPNRIDRSVVRLAFTADPSVKIVRDELLEDD